MSQDATVCIVDGDTRYRDSLAELVRSQDLRTETYATTDEFYAAFNDTQPGCVIIDVDSCNGDGFRLLESLQQYSLCPPIIVVTREPDVATAVRAMKQGAFDFLPKSSSDAAFCESVARAIAVDAKHRALHERQQSLWRRLIDLKSNERQVLDLVLAGHPNKRIAAVLGVSRRAVEDRRARVMKKLRVDSLPKLVRFALDAGVRIDG